MNIETLSYLIHWQSQNYNSHFGAVKSGRCREVQTRVNVWTVCPNSGRCREFAVVERWSLVEVQL